MALQHWMTFGTFAEQNYYIYPDKETYDGIVFNATMAAFAPSGLANFLLQKTKPQIYYIIDPLTHAFQHNPTFISSKKSDGSLEIKKPIQKLATVYGEPIKSIAGIEPVFPNNFSTETIKSFTENVLKYQKHCLSSLMFESQENKKYLEYDTKDLEPYALITPYFYLTEGNYKPWFNIMLNCIDVAAQDENFKECKLFTAFVINKGVLLNSTIRAELISSYQSKPLNGCLLWIDEFDEQDTSSTELKALLDLIHGLRNNDREVINLHGGFFSILTGSGKFGSPSFTGVAHGPEYGESRAVVPVGGGIPIARYYIRALHKRVKYNDAIFYLRKKGWLESALLFYQNVCDCKICRDTIKDDSGNFSLFGITDSKPIKRGNSYVTFEYPTKETKDRCLMHYLESKKIEFDFVANASNAEIIKSIKKAINDFETVTGNDSTDYLKLWLSALGA